MNRKLLPILLLFICFRGSAFADHLSSSLLFTAQLSGDNEVPEVTTNAQGVASISFDEKKTTLYYTVFLSNLSSPITGMHIHEAPEGENGPVVFNLTSALNGNRAKGVIENFSRSAFAKLITGDYYINVHTENNPGGEIRGQVRLETDFRFAARLDGSQEVPSVVTEGQGLFVATISSAGTQMDFNMVFQGLSSPVVGAHIHNAPAGVNGGVIVDLASFIFGNVISGSLDIGDFIAALRAGELYVNVHTVNHPGGEIRGQLLLDEGLMFDVVLNGDLESPPVETSGRGIGMITVSPDLSEVSYFIVFDSLSGPAADAHLHFGAPGANGGVMLDLSDDIDDNVISGNAPLTIELLNAMLEGNIYLNVHTDENPGGEIRGQVYKLAREAYTFEMNGGQEVPPVTTNATGGGIVSIDRDQSNAHYMIVYSGLSSNFTGAHFHNGAPGENGGVVFDLTDEFNEFGGAFGYWDHNDAPAFEASELFRENEIYVNVHSDLHPGGEIRGNVIRSRDLFIALPFDPMFSNDLLLAAELNGDNENPPVTTNAVGVATVYFNEDRTSATVNVTVSGLSGPITGAHIHAGISGQNGPVVFPLNPVGNRIQQVITGITTDQLGQLLGGGMYINVHTAENPGGEIRGQLFLEQDLSFIALMGGDQENPPVTTDGRGLGVFHYTIGQLSLDVNVQLTELSSAITGAHLHQGMVGENGPVVIDLGPLLDGNRIQGRVELTLNDLLLLFTGNLYINVHTENNPGGEIRGQLFFQNGLGFDGWMDGLQENPFVTTTGSGLAAATVSNDLTTVEVWMVTDGLSGEVGAAHFHQAPLGENGGVVLDLTPGLEDSDIHATGPVNDAIVDALLTGNIYINAHTPAFQGGEIRGQMYRLARDGYGFDLCSEQETGTVNAPNAEGSGMVSIDRLHTNFNIITVADGLTGDITGAHFHRAPIGVNGPVIADFTPFFNDNLLSGAGVEVDTSIINPILAGNVYVNVHTSLHPGGEIRGQVVKENLCSLETGVEELSHLLHEVSLSPVPVYDNLNVTLDAIQNTTLQMNVLDLSGKLISTGQYEMLQGRNDIMINTDDLHAGFYILMISDGHAAAAYKFVK